MSIYGRELGGPYDTRALNTRRSGLYWAREWAHANADQGEFFNSDPDPVNFPNAIRAIDSARGALTVRTQRSINTGDVTAGTPNPRGTNFLIPDWVQGPTQVPETYPNRTDAALDGFRTIALYARLRFFAVQPVFQPFDPFSGDPLPACSLWLGPEPYVGDQASPFPFATVTIRPDITLQNSSPDAPPATYSTVATPPATNNALWAVRPSALSLEQWQVGPGMTLGFYSPGFGNSLIIRALFPTQEKAAAQVAGNVWVSATGEDWQYVGDIGFDSTLLDPLATGLRRVGLSVRGNAYGALDFLRIYAVQYPDVFTPQDIIDRSPFVVEEGMPDAGAQFFGPLG